MSKSHWIVAFSAKNSKIIKYNLQLAEAGKGGWGGGGVWEIISKY